MGEIFCEKLKFIDIPQFKLIVNEMTEELTRLGKEKSVRTYAEHGLIVPKPLSLKGLLRPHTQYINLVAKKKGDPRIRVIQRLITSQVILRPYKKIGCISEEEFVTSIWGTYAPEDLRGSGDYIELGKYCMKLSKELGAKKVIAAVYGDTLLRPAHVIMGEQDPIKFEKEGSIFYLFQKELDSD